MNMPMIAGSPPAPAPSARILVIDDDDQLRSFILTLLKRRGFDVTGVISGREGKALLGRETFDLIITDLLMPNEEGLGTIRWVRARGDGQPKIIAISGGGSERACYLQHATMFGADATLAKPFAPPELLDLIVRLLPKLQAGQAAAPS